MLSHSGKFLLVGSKVGGGGFRPEGAEVKGSFEGTDPGAEGGTGAGAAGGTGPGAAGVVLVVVLVKLEVVVVVEVDVGVDIVVEVDVAVVITVAAVLNTSALILAASDSVVTTLTFSVVGKRVYLSELRSAFFFAMFFLIN